MRWPWRRLSDSELRERRNEAAVRSGRGMIELPTEPAVPITIADMGGLVYHEFVEAERDRYKRALTAIARQRWQGEKPLSVSVAEDALRPRPITPNPGVSQS